MVAPDQWIASLDLKNTYIHVPIQSSHQKFLRFHWQGQTYQFQALPFGLSMAPWVFTKVLVLIIVYLRRQGIQIFVYMDDILMVRNSLQEVKWSVQTALRILTQSGYIINLKRSDLTPVHDLVYIGGWFWTDVALIFLTDPRKDVLISCFLSFCRAGTYNPAHQFLRVLGLIVETLLVI